MIGIALKTRKDVERAYKNSWIAFLSCHHHDYPLELIYVLFSFHFSNVFVSMLFVLLFLVVCAIFTQLNNLFLMNILLNVVLVICLLFFSFMHIDIQEIIIIKFHFFPFTSKSTTMGD